MNIFFGIEKFFAMQKRRINSPHSKLANAFDLCIRCTCVAILPLGVKCAHPLIGLLRYKTSL